MVSFEEYFDEWHFVSGVFREGHGEKLFGTAANLSCKTFFFCL